MPGLCGWNSVRVVNACSGFGFSVFLTTVYFGPQESEILLLLNSICYRNGSSHVEKRKLVIKAAEGTTLITFQILWRQGRYIWKLIWWNAIIWFGNAGFFGFSASKNGGSYQDTLSWKFSKMLLYPVKQNLTARKKLHLLWVLSSLENSFCQILGFACFII